MAATMEHQLQTLETFSARQVLGWTLGAAVRGSLRVIPEFVGRGGRRANRHEPDVDARTRRHGDVGNLAVRGGKASMPFASWVPPDAPGYCGSMPARGSGSADDRTAQRQPMYGRRVRVAQATLRPGRHVQVIDLSPMDVLVETDRPLRPGSLVHIRLVTEACTVSLAALIVHCSVSAVHPEAGITYRGGCGSMNGVSG